MSETASKILCLNERFLSGNLFSKPGDPVYFSFKKQFTFFFMLRGLSTETMESDMGQVESHYRSGTGYMYFWGGA